eukprot:6152809-Amphidinium_carterae.2
MQSCEAHGWYQSTKRCLQQLGPPFRRHGLGQLSDKRKEDDQETKAKRIKTIVSCNARLVPCMRPEQKQLVLSSKSTWRQFRTDKWPMDCVYGLREPELDLAIDIRRKTDESKLQVYIYRKKHSLSQACILTFATAMMCLWSSSTIRVVVQLLLVWSEVIVAGLTNSCCGRKERVSLMVVDSVIDVLDDKHHDELKGEGRLPVAKAKVVMFAVSSL